MNALVNLNNKTIGKVKENTFTKSVRESIHKMRMLNSYGIDKDVLLALKDAGVTEIVIRETEHKQVYRTTVETYLSRGMTYNFGHGEQVFLQLHHFNK